MAVGKLGGVITFGFIVAVALFFSCSHVNYNDAFILWGNGETYVQHAVVYTLMRACLFFVNVGEFPFRYDYYYYNAVGVWAANDI